jgi:hypothetical protein
MLADIALKILVGTLFFGGIGFVVYLAHRLTAPAAKRMRENAERAYYAGMVARGRTVQLPRTWRSQGLAGHERRQLSDLALVLKWSLAVAGAVYGVMALFWGAWSESVGYFAASSSIMILLLAGVFLSERRRVKRVMADAALVPRTEFNIVANAHGLFVPTVDRTLSGAWADWIVTDVDLPYGKYGIAGCERLSLAKREEPQVVIPLIASTIDNGAELMEVIAARVERVAADRAGRGLVRNR